MRVSQLFKQRAINVVTFEQAGDESLITITLQNFVSFYTTQGYDSKKTFWDKV